MLHSPSSNSFQSGQLLLQAPVLLRLYGSLFYWVGGGSLEFCFHVWLYYWLLFSAEEFDCSVSLGFCYLLLRIFNRMTLHSSPEQLSVTLTISAPRALSLLVFNNKT